MRVWHVAVVTQKMMKIVLKMAITHLKTLRINQIMKIPIPIQTPHHVKTGDTTAAQIAEVTVVEIGTSVVIVIATEEIATGEIATGEIVAVIVTAIEVASASVRSLSPKMMSCYLWVAF
jgi:hypothetical protein